jgi:hypothetical protein
MYNSNTLFANLWDQYTKESPEALTIYNLFVAQGETVINDHVAFRTFDDPRVDVSALGKLFQDFGYVARGDYEFKVKKLFAQHFEHISDSTKPKIFISQLQTKEFSPLVQQVAQQCIDRIATTKLTSPELLYSGVHWDLDYTTYQKLLLESEYAAWLYVFGFRANHFTVLVNELRTLGSIELVNEFLKSNHLTLNPAGGEIKGTPEQLLEQSSTMANKVMVKFKQGSFAVLNSYYEFARRYPEKGGKLYQGFIAASADKIFESTDVKLANKVNYESTGL